MAALTVTVANPFSNITAPTNGATLSGASDTITGTASAGFGVQKVEVSTDGGTTWHLATDTSGLGTWATWSYNWTLPANGSYTIKSRATDNANNIETPGAGVTVTVANLPGAPTAVSATVGNGQAVVYFSPPASNGGSAITSYTVTSSPGGITATGASSPITVTGLTNGTAYTFTVTATNAAGAGPASAASNSVTPSAASAAKKVFSWGYNAPTTPSLVTNLSGVAAVAGGAYHSIALQSNGYVSAWGYNADGELGDGTTNNTQWPECIGFSGVTAIAGGAYDTYVVKSDGTVWASGGDYYGQLGNGTQDNQAHPYGGQVSGLTNVAAVSAGLGYAVALKSDGTVWAWGDNDEGQLGDGTFTNRYTPVQVSGLSGVIAIACGEGHTLALKSDGTVWTWGDNDNGALGDGTYTDKKFAAQVPGLTGIIAVAGGGDDSLAVKSDGTVWAWGDNLYGQLGIGTSDWWPHTAPVQVHGLSGITAVACGEWHEAALKSDGTVWTWGDNYYGQLGNGASDSNPHPNPAQVSGLTGVGSIGAGYYHTLAVQYSVDSTPPSSSVGSPGIGAMLRGASYTISGWAWDEMYGSGVQYVDVSTDGGGTWSRAGGTLYCDGWYYWSYTWTLPVDGTYTIKSRATDNAGNVETPPGDITVIVDNTPPSSAVTSPSGGAILSGATRSITGTASDNLSGVQKVDVMITPSGGGTGWTAVNNGLTYTDINALAVSPNYAADHTVYAGTQHYGVFKSTNGGASWTTSNTGIPLDIYGYRDVNSLAISPNYSTDHTVYAGSQYDGVFKSTDGGATWAAVNTGITNLHINTLVVSPNYATDHTTYAGSYDDGVFKSTNGGASWTVSSSGIPFDIYYYSREVSSLAISPNYAADHTVYAGSQYDGVFKSTDGGATWAAVNTGITNLYINTLVVSPNYATDHTVYAGTWYDGVFKTIDGGATWAAVNAGITNWWIQALTVSPNYATDHTVYAGTSYGGVFKTIDGGASWAAVNAGITNLWIQALTISPNYATDNTVFVVSWDGAFKSTNAGGPPSYTVPATDTSGNGSWSSWSFNWTLPSDGGYTIQSRATDKAGNVETPGAGNAVTVDNTPPVVSAGGNKIANAQFTQAATATDANPMTYAWSKVSGPGTITFGSQTALSTTVSASADGAYVMRFTATDAAGNSASSTMNLTWDAAPPSSAITAPATGAMLTGVNYTITGTAADNLSGVQYVDVSTDGGGSWHRASGTTGWSYSWTLSANDSYTIQSRATDNAGNIETPGAGVTVMVSNNANAASPVWTWGYNQYGQLGDGTTTDKHTPVQVSGLGGVTAVAGGGYYTIARKSDGTVWTWGSNGNGQLGDGTTTDRHAPVQVSGLSGIVAVAGHTDHATALKSDGTVWAWGANYDGQLGDGTTTERHTPVRVSGLNNVAAIAGGYDHTLALKSDGTVWAWGWNDSGQLGDGTRTQKHAPVQVLGPGGSGYLTGVTAIACGGWHSIALKSDGTIWVWGANNAGELGDGTTTDKHTPIQVSGLTGVTAVAGGGHHYTIALKSDGTVWTWGSNSDYLEVGRGQLGDGTTIQRHTPVQVLGPGGSGYLTGVTAIAGGYCNTTALKSDGTVYAWGCNGYGRLGDGTTTDRYTPVQVSGLSGITAIAGGSNHTIALKGGGFGGGGNPELQHYNWNPVMDSGDCAFCHIASGTFTTASTVSSAGFCYSCHNAAGNAHADAIPSIPLPPPGEHPMMVNVTSGGGRFPTYGNITAGEYNNEPLSRLAPGNLITCATCHNSMQKTEDYGRSWEYTTTADQKTYTLQWGGWNTEGCLAPKVYRDTSLWAGPTYSQRRKAFLVDPSEYTYNENAGTITFSTAQSSSDYIYVTLDYPYLRASSEGNRLCADCHTQATHENANCLNCHQAHNTTNLKGVSENVRTLDYTTIGVKFTRYTGVNSFADGDGSYDGICEVCHTTTKYYRRDGSQPFANHSGGVNYDRTNCTACHTHASGFAR